MKSFLKKKYSFQQQGIYTQPCINGVNSCRIVEGGLFFQ